MFEQLTGNFRAGPQFWGLVGGLRPYLAVISRESDAHDILGVVFETASGLAGAQVPQPQGLVPGAG